MAKQRATATMGAWCGVLARFLLVGVFVALSAVPGAAQTAVGGDGFHIQVFALNGPACGGPVIFGEECPDVLLPGAELVLQRLNRRTRDWEDVVQFTTNRSGYEHLAVHRRGLYRVDVPAVDSGEIMPAPMPLFLGPVTFRVPARHVAADDFQVTPVVVNFDSGIR